jgi:hypothetical protein
MQAERSWMDLFEEEKRKQPYISQNKGVKFDELKLITIFVLDKDTTSK